MNQTNIRDASQLLDHVNAVLDDQAKIMPFDKEVYNQYGPISQEDIDKFSRLLNCGIHDQWVSSKGYEAFKPVGASPPLHIPTIRVSPGLDPESDRNVYMPDYEDPTTRPKEPLSYIVIVQGINASERSKIVINSSLKATARAMLHEAMNGFSTVFSGAIFPSDMARVFGPDRRPIQFVFKKVKNLDELNGMPPMPLKGEIGLLC